MSEIIVLGAGMVGVSAALELQSRGHHVVLVDRTTPGIETSFGNAGIIQAEAAEPYALPRDLSTLMRFGLGFTNDVVWSMSGLFKMIPALWKYFGYSSATSHQHISQHYAQLTGRSTLDHQPLISASQSEDLIKRDGLCMLYRHEKEFGEAVKEAQYCLEAYGVTSRVYSGEEYRQQEPALKSTPAGVIHWDQSWSCRSPGKLTQAYADLFVNRGGELITADAMQLKQQGESWVLPTQQGNIEAEHVVVALGPWSPELLKPLGYHIPMVYKRGYHGHFAVKETLQRPFLDTANGILATNTVEGLRLCTGAALVDMSAPAEPVQLNRGEKAIRELLDFGERVEEPQWFGTRPCMPDMMPVVGAAPKHKGLWFNFGHGHQGFTLGPTTAMLLADAMENKTNLLQVPLDPSGRF